MSARRPRVLGHRGASGHAYENSLAAFRAAREFGADGVELDVHATRDGALLVHHDPIIPGLGAIASLMLGTARTATLPNGETIPTLDEALEVLAGLEVWVEVKALPSSLDPHLLATLAAAPDIQSGVHSFDHRIVARLGTLAPGLRLGVLSASYPLDSVAPMLAAGARTLWQEASLLDRHLVDAVHAVGGEVVAWTVNEADLAERLAGWGVDVLCGNYPERLRRR